MRFVINGITWEIVYVNSDSDLLLNSSGNYTVGVCDNNTKCVYISDLVHGAFLRKIICHELVHCFMFSYAISIPLEQEEFMADWISVYGEDLIYLLDDIMRSVKERIA